MNPWHLKWKRPHLDELFIRLEKGDCKITPAFFYELLEALQLDNPIISPLGIWDLDEAEAIEESNVIAIIERSTPEWIDAIGKMILHPPFWLKQNYKSRAFWPYDMIWLFEALIRRFPDDGWLTLSLLLQEGNNREAFELFHGPLPNHINTADELLRIYLSSE